MIKDVQQGQVQQGQAQQGQAKKKDVHLLCFFGASKTKNAKQQQKEDV